ncbi:MAG: FlgO family outer membrane protein [Campylobacterota bacterium]|nr:FlgO family outer membrane protein [Campylobacterota bacterium]
MPHKSKLLSALFASALLAGSVFGAEKDTDMKKVVSEVEYNAQTKDQKLKLAQQELARAKEAEMTITTQDTLEGTISSLAMQMMQNKKINTSKSFIVTSFVRLDNLKKTTEFGRILSESMLNELSIRGFNITEFRGQLSVSVNNNGEYFITRDPTKLKNAIQNTYVVVGTYSRQYKRIMVNARVIDNMTGQVISSARASYAHGLRDDCAIFKDCAAPRTIKIIEEK